MFLDRGISERLAWLRLAGAAIEHRRAKATARCRYADKVLVAEPWPEVCVCDGERCASFEQAARSHALTVAAYRDAGYETFVIPKVSVQERVAWVLSQLETSA